LHQVQNNNKIIQQEDQKVKSHLLYITIENHDVFLHNCMIDTGATNNIMPLSIMEALGMGCTKYYETGESIYAIDSRKVRHMEKLNIFMLG
jgi:hypothetical protein